jgi:hypothetical protein
MVDKYTVTKDDYFIYSSEEGYSPSQQKVAMQVIELYDMVMTVRCNKNGCITKPYEHFTKVEDISKFKKNNIVHSDYFKNNLLGNIYLKN